DESVIDSPAGRLMMLCLVVVEDVAYVEGALNAELQRVRADPFYGGERKALEKRGLHFADLPEDTRATTATALEGLPLRVHVVSDTLSDDSSYAATYLRLLRELVNRRFLASDGQEVRLVVEENPKVKLTTVPEEFNQRLAAPALRNSRRPSRVEFAIATKSTTPLIALP